MFLLYSFLSFTYVVCVHVCIHVCTCGSARVSMCRNVHACGRPKLIRDVYLDRSPLYLLKEDLSLNLELANSSYYSNPVFPGDATSTSAVLTATIPAQLLEGFWRSKLQSLCFTPWAVSPAPTLSEISQFTLFVIFSLLLYILTAFLLFYILTIEILCF